MAILEVDEINEGREGSENEKGQRTYVRVFGVTTSSASDGSVTVRQATGVPRVGDPYTTDTEQDLGAYVKKVTPQVTDNAKHWHVRIEYDSSFDPEQEENPLDRPLEIAWSFVKDKKLVDKDIDGNAILNSAWENFLEPIEVDDSRPTLTIVRNEAAFDPALAIDYQDAVNEDSFMGFEPGQAKVCGISAASRFENNVRFWEVTYEFEFRREGWILRVKDMGMTTRVGSITRCPIYENFEDGTGNAVEISTPVNLDGNGQVLENPSPDTVFYLPFTVYKQRPFSAFSF
jgi:hypothetical protein